MLAGLSFIIAFVSPIRTGMSREEYMNIIAWYGGGSFMLFMIAIIVSVPVYLKSSPIQFRIGIALLLVVRLVDVGSLGLWIQLYKNFV